MLNRFCLDRSFSLLFFSIAFLIRMISGDLYLRLSSFGFCREDVEEKEQRRRLHCRGRDQQASAGRESSVPSQMEGDCLKKLW